MTNNHLFPIFLKLENLRVLIVGGGKVAEEKLHFMLKSSVNAQITLVAPTISDEVLLLLQDRQYFTKIIRREIKEGDVNDHDIIIAATNQNEVNKKIYNWSKSNGKIINVADTPGLCDFYMGSIVTRGDLKIAISTNGKSPTFAKRMRQVLEAILPEESNNLLQQLQTIRDSLKGNFEFKVKRLNEITALLIDKK